MSSNAPSPPLDLERGLATTSEDVAALRRARRLRPLTPAEYERFLAQFQASTEELRARPCPRGCEPFRL